MPHTGDFKDYSYGCSKVEAKKEKRVRMYGGMRCRQAHIIRIPLPQQPHYSTLVMCEEGIRGVEKSTYILCGSSPHHHLEPQHDDSDLTSMHTSPPISLAANRVPGRLGRVGVCLIYWQEAWVHRQFLRSLLNRKPIGANSNLDKTQWPDGDGAQCRAW